MNYNTIFKTWEKNLYLEAKNSNYDNLKTIRDNRKIFFILSVWYYIILRNIHVWQHMVTSHFQLSMEWSKYKYIIFYRNKCCKDSIDTGKFTANHKESNIYIRNLPLNEIPLLSVRDILTRPIWRETTHPGNPDARAILTLGTSWRQKLQTFALCFFSFSSFRFSALRHSYAFND